MPIKILNRVLAPNLEVDGAAINLGDASVPRAGVHVQRSAVAARRDLYTLSGIVIPVAAAQDFASLKLCDLPSGRLMIVGVVVNLAIEVSAQINPITIVDFAVGTEAATSTALAGIQQNLVAKIDAPITGLIRGEGPTLVSFLSGIGAKAVYLNWAAAVDQDATITVSGDVVISYIDIGGSVTGASMGG